MSAESISSVNASATQRVAASVVPAPAAGVDKVAQAATGAKAPDVPKKAEIDFDPKERRKELQDAIDRLNDQMRQNGRALEFGVDTVLDRTIVTVKNSETGKVIRQLPDETLLRLAHHLEEVKGLFQDDHI